MISNEELKITPINSLEELKSLKQGIIVNTKQGLENDPLPQVYAGTNWYGYSFIKQDERSNDVIELSFKNWGLRFSHVKGIVFFISMGQLDVYTPEGKTEKRNVRYQDMVQLLKEVDMWEDKK